VYEMLVGHEPFWGSTEELRVKVLSVDLRYPPGLLSQESINLFYCLLQRDPRHRVPAHRLLTEHPWLLPAVAALAPLWQGQPEITQVVQPPLAHATFECVSVDAPIARSVDVSGPFSFYPPVPQQDAEVAASQHPGASSQSPEGAATPPTQPGPPRSPVESMVEPAPSSGASDTAVHLAAEDPQLPPAEGPAAELQTAEDQQPSPAGDQQPPVAEAEEHGLSADLHELSPTSPATLASNSDTPPAVPEATSGGEDNFCKECTDVPSTATDAMATTGTGCAPEDEDRPSVSVTRVIAPRPKEGDLADEAEVSPSTQQDPMLGGA
jgi:hypothetical protein